MISLLLYGILDNSFFHSPLQSRPFLKDRKKFIQLVDPQLQGNFPVRALHHAIAITAMCLQEQPNFRPLIGDIVVALEYLASESHSSEPHRNQVRLPSSSPSQGSRNSNNFLQEPYSRNIF